MPTKVFTPGEILTAADTNAYLANRPLQNAIINGAFEINQRGFTSTTGASYGFDRWRLGVGGGTATYSAQAFTPGAAPIAGYEGTNFAQLATVGQSASGNFAYLVQPVEDVRTFAGQTVTISVFAKASSGTPNLGISVEQNFGSGGSALVPTSAGVQAITTSWVRYSFTVAIPSVAGKTIGAGSSLIIGLMTSAGTDISAAGYPAVGLQNTTIDFWGVQLEAGTVANDFRRNANSLQGELAACQRYYYQVGPGFAAFSRIVGGFYEANNVFASIVPLPVQMRTSPTSVGFSNITSYDGINTIAVSSVALNGASPTFGGINSIVSGATQTRPGFLALAGTDSFISFSAEL
jgi:hypothetical protein